MNLWKPISLEQMLSRFQSAGLERHVYDCEAITAARDASFVGGLSFYVPVSAESSEDYLALITWRNGDREAEVGTEKLDLIQDGIKLIQGHFAPKEGECLLTLTQEELFETVSIREAFRIKETPFAQKIYGVRSGDFETELLKDVCRIRAGENFSFDDSIDPEFSQLRERIRSLSDSDEKCYLALQNQTVIGYLMAERCYESYFDIVYLYVAPAFRSKGIGTALAQYFAADCAKNREKAHFGRADNAASEKVAAKAKYSLSSVFYTAPMELIKR